MSRNLFSRKLWEILGGGVKQVAIINVNHNALWSLCLIIIGNNCTVVLMHNTFIYNMFVGKYAMNIAYLKNSWKTPKWEILAKNLGDG